MDAIKQSMQSKLESCGLPCHEVNVFGRIRCNVHVTCVGRDTAHKWAQLLASVSVSKTNVVATSWEAAKNQNTTMRPTMIDGFLVSVAF